jgi:hypothetical protein
MVNKKASPRTMPLITRESYNVEKSPVTPGWMDEFVSALQKSAVEPMRSSQPTIFDQISSIMGRKSKHATVEAAVEDMKERSGLTAYLKVQSTEDNYANTKKRAQQAEIKLFKQVPQVKSTLDNYIDDSRGNLPIPAIVEQVKSIHKFDVPDDLAWDDPALMTYINNKNIEVKKKYPDQDAEQTTLGRNPNYTDEDMDPSNTDALHGLNPAVVTSKNDYTGLILSYRQKK